MLGLFGVIVCFSSFDIFLYFCDIFAVYDFVIIITIILIIFFYYLHALLTFYSNKKIYIIIYQCLENVKFLLSPTPQALNEDQVFFFKTKIVFHVPDQDQDQDQSLETTCVL